ncbi:hypothetical protein ACN5PC_10860, partial [Aliarcobacter butzleri]|uniref:hypothetical protein n=1 Tax=Aliarcobacter butzleri TaxID=28197 RepID=UPI003AF4A096
KVEGAAKFPILELFVFKIAGLIPGSVPITIKDEKFSLKCFIAALVAVLQATIKASILYSFKS